jgi:hypothetical protein
MSQLMTEQLARLFCSLLVAQNPSGSTDFSKAVNLASKVFSFASTSGIAPTISFEGVGIEIYEEKKNLSIKQ